MAPSPRPRCAACNKPFGRRAIQIERLVVEIGQPIPPPSSNLPMVFEEYNPPLPTDGGPATPEEATSWRYMSADPDDDGKPRMIGLGHLRKEHRKGRSVERHYWDGETYRGKYGPFCTQACGVAFAECAHRNGFRVEGGAP